LYKQSSRFILTNVYKTIFLQHQHNQHKIQSRQTLAFAIFQARKKNFSKI